MAWLGIPVTTDPDRELTVMLEGTNYVIATRWNTRSYAWYLDVLTEDGETLISGRRVVTGVPVVGWRETVDGLFPGQIWAYDTSGYELPPTLDDFGSRVLLLYREAE